MTLSTMLKYAGVIVIATLRAVPITIVELLKRLLKGRAK